MESGARQKAREVTGKIELAIKQWKKDCETHEGANALNEFDVILDTLEGEFSHFDPPGHV